MTLSEDYEQILLDLFSLPFPDGDMPLIKLNGDAVAVYRDFSEMIEKRLLTDLEDMSDWGGNGSENCGSASLCGESNLSEQSTCVRAHDETGN